MADIHSNREAFSACLAHARGQGADRFVFLGDYVGYGADPEWTVETLVDLISRGAIAIRGNHDEAVSHHSGTMNSDAAVAVEWTRGRLPPETRRWLDTLPMTVEEDDRLYVHADASQPERWLYVSDGEAARHSLESTQARLTFCGHVHIPGIYGLSGLGKLTPFRPQPGIAVPLLVQRRWLAVIGSVGQPRDGDPAACYAIFDPDRTELTFHRVAYDIDRTARKIREAGLPDSLAARLYRGH